MTRQLVVYAAKGEVISPTLLRVTAGRSTTRESREIKKGYRAGENRTKPAEKARKQAKAKRNSNDKLENNQVLRVEIKSKAYEFKLFL